MVDLVNLDFHKTCDQVPHDRVISKVAALGTAGTLAK